MQTDESPQPDPTGSVPVPEASPDSNASSWSLPLLLLTGAVVFALVSGGSFLVVPRLLDPGDPSNTEPAAEPP